MGLVKTAAVHPERILSFEEARAVVEDCAKQLLRAASFPTESVDLLSAPGRVLAEQITADRDLPPFDRAARDGFVVAADGVAQATEPAPVSLRVVGETKAGAPQYSAPLNPGEALEIMTGAPAPKGHGYAIVMVEHTTRSGNELRVTRAVRAGENIIAAGSEASKGDALLRPGHRLDVAAIAVAASVGRPRLAVHRRWKVSRP